MLLKPPTSLPYLHVAWWNLLPFRKHLLGDSLHSQEHFVLLRGWCLGHVLLHVHWQVSLLKTWFNGQEEAGGVLQTHWHVLWSRWRLEPQSWLWSLCWHTHWQVSTSSSLSGPHTSAENMSVEMEGEGKTQVGFVKWPETNSALIYSVSFDFSSSFFFHFLILPVSYSGVTVPQRTESVLLKLNPLQNMSIRQII